MQYMWIVAGDDGRPRQYYRTMKEPPCRLLTLEEFKELSSRRDTTFPLMLVVDTRDLSALEVHSISRVADANPAVLLVHIIPRDRERDTPRLLCDETIQTQESAYDLSWQLDRLLKRSGPLALIADIHHRIGNGMGASPIVGKSPAFRRLLEQLPAVAAMDSTVLLQGETGTGKELIARALHYLGERAGKAFITVDCAALPETLVENELFGHSRGAYTDGSARAVGLVQEADGGTLFLDEIECLSLHAQGKFLRLLQERSFKPLGQSRSISIDTRIIAATNVNIEEIVDRKEFRKDLFYRLNVIPLTIPPLRDRKSDIALLVRFFLHRHAGSDAARCAFPLSLLHGWMQEEWPGNVRELENRVQEWLALSTFSRTGSEAVRASAAPPAKALREFREDADRRYLRLLMSQTKGNISAAARIADLDRKNLRILLKKTGLDPAEFRV